MNIKELINKLEKNSCFHNFREDNDPGFYVFDYENTLQIRIFSHEYPNENISGYILVDYKETFDKWGTGYYRCPLPTNEFQLDLFLKDMHYLYVEEKTNVWASDERGSLIRTF